MKKFRGSCRKFFGSSLTGFLVLVEMKLYELESGDDFRLRIFDAFRFLIEDNILNCVKDEPIEPFAPL